MGRWRLFYEPSEEEIRSSVRKKILKRLPKVLKSSHTVWCRAGEVVANAEPCYWHTCKYKKNKDDIINGCAECQRFQITTMSLDWASARHTHKYGSVEKNDCPHF